MEIIKINVGCGAGWQAEGWIGVDYDATSAAWNFKGSEEKTYVNANVLEGLPFENNSVDEIYCSHMLEHFTYQEGIIVLAEFYRVLKPEGILALIVPDLDIYIEKFVKRDENFLNTADIIGGIPLDNLVDNFLMNFYSAPMFNNTCHKYSYNFENLNCALSRYKFKQIQKVKYRHFTYNTELNSIPFLPMPEHAEEFSLCIECKKSNEFFDYSLAPFYQYSQQFVSTNKETADLLQELQVLKQLLNDTKIASKELQLKIEEYEYNIELLEKDKISIQLQLSKNILEIENLHEKIAEEGKKNINLEEHLQKISNANRSLENRMQKLLVLNGNMEEQVQLLKHENALCRNELDNIYNSKGWRLLKILYRIKSFFTPK